MRAARIFIEESKELGVFDKIRQVRVDLYGSLAATGIGHGTDTAILLGLEGETPEGVDTDTIKSRVDVIKETKSLTLGSNKISFDPKTNIVFHKESLPQHPNGMRLSTYDAEGDLLSVNEFYSIGGGFVVNEKTRVADNVYYKDARVDHALDPSSVDVSEIHFLNGKSKPQSKKGRPVSPSSPARTAQNFVRAALPFHNAASLLDICEKEKLSIAQVVYKNELQWRSSEEIKKRLLGIWDVMNKSIENGINSTETYLPGLLKVKRRSPALYKQLMANVGQQNGQPVPNLAKSPVLSALSVFAIAVQEENAAMRRVVTAPTNGAAGVVPSVLKCYLTFFSPPNRSLIDQEREYLLTAAAIGMLYKRGASISAAEGCQGEIGVATSMSAAGICAILGGTPQQVENAAEIGMEHSLGLTCDPVNGAVLIPCIERNAIGSVKAVTSAQLALNGDGSHKVSLDNVIETMRQTGLEMSHKYKETSLGGLAINVPVC
ncbi:L-serine ammonia-lyase [Synchytrium microbalum]|uniref:L-serine ammonia-lyase n=1 Tax=Synchytrium microbalum TaxID=1806994 RepID=A0A507C8H8_9FUNG|nr:L-serine ammonia-lyase [Synchytrium microbalum]TPX35449.1 L-serine ammonia-lyase [Synchytrium microbalum]